MLANRVSSRRMSTARFSEWAKKIVDDLIEPQLGVMLDWALKIETEIRQSIQDWSEARTDCTSQRARASGGAIQNCLGHISQKESWSIVQNCGRNGLEAWRSLHKRFDPLTGGRRRNLLRAIMASQRVKLEDLVSALQTRGEWLIGTTRKTPTSEKSS